PAAPVSAATPSPRRRRRRGAPATRDPGELPAPPAAELEPPGHEAVQAETVAPGAPSRRRRRPPSGADPVALALREPEPSRAGPRSRRPAEGASPARGTPSAGGTAPQTPAIGPPQRRRAAPARERRLGSRTGRRPAPPARPLAGLSCARGEFEYGIAPSA